MPLKMIWANQSQVEDVVQTRVRCYAPAAKEIERYRENLQKDTRGKIGDYLLAQGADGRFVGTTTSLSMRMWVRGGVVLCQGVAFVGTVKTARRAASARKSNERGIASQLMVETLNRARERNEVVSALMPFRASFYEHFGYGFAERRAEWTLPLSILPQGDFEGMRFKEPQDHAAIEACRQRVCESGQCDIETSHGAWLNRWRYAEEGIEVVDRPDDSGPVRGFLFIVEEKRDEKKVLRVADHGADSFEAFRRQLHFLGSMKDQYSGVVMTLPGDVPLNRLLRETQLPHRAVEHATALAKPYTRMQIRVLDHKRFLEAMKLPASAKGGCVVAVRENEGSVSKFRIDLSDGHASVSKSDAAADVECTDVQWASIASGDIAASEAARFGLIEVRNQAALSVLDTLAVGPAPFCREYF
jgi:predicted acetyltransferase